MKRLILFGACLVIACFSAADVAKPGETGSILPLFKTVDLKGQNIEATSLKGKVVIIDFWATWCPPCKKEMPGFQALQDRYGKEGLEVIGFKSTMMQDSEDVQQFLKELGIRYRIANSSVDLEQQFGGLLGLPTTFIYDRKGTLHSKIIGFEATEKIEAIIKPLLEAR